MIEELQAKSGHPVVTRQGKLLASKYDPIAEAKLFVDSLNLNLSEYQVLFLLGAGCGYQIMEIKNRFPDLELVVIEEDESLITWNRDVHEFDQVNFHSLKISNPVSSVMLQNYLYKVFGVTFSLGYQDQDHGDLYRDYFRTLIARDSSSMEFCLKSLRIENSFPRLKKKYVEGEITVKDLELSVKEAELETNLNTDFQILRELIA